MAPPSTSRELFFARYQTPILLSTFAVQVGHHQYIKRTEPLIASSAAGTIRTNFPRTLRAGLGWGLVFLGLLTEITLAKQAVRDSTDPILANSLQRKPWKRTSEAS